MTTIPLKEILTRIRPLPWPVNSKPAIEGAMTQQELEMTRIYRRHAANVLPELVEAIRHFEKMELLFMVSKTDFQQMPFDRKIKKQMENASLEKGKAGQRLMKAVAQSEQIEIEP